MDYESYFARKQVWEVDVASDLFWRQKFRALAAMISDEVVSILDVGCGNGVFARLLADRFQVFGADRSFTALALAQTPVACCSADRMPFGDGAFDLVVSSEMLEHLPETQMVAAAAELRRLSRRWIAISVPYNENLRLRYTKCPQCRQIFHYYGHLHSFDRQRLQTLFPDCRLAMWTHCGQYQWVYHPLLLAVRQRLGNRWFYRDQGYPCCPRCGNEDFSPIGNRIADWCDSLNRRYWGRQVSEYPYWIVALWEKEAR